MENDEIRRMATDAMNGMPAPPHLGFTSWESAEGVRWLAEQLETAVSEVDLGREFTRAIESAKERIDDALEALEG